MKRHMYKKSFIGERKKNCTKILNESWTSWCYLQTKQNGLREDSDTLAMNCMHVANGFL